MQEQVIYEPEDIVVKDGVMYVNTNTNAKKTSDLPCIFKLSLPKEKPGEPKILSTRYAGIRNVRRRVLCDRSFTSGYAGAPKDNTPFYINGYFRHGARQIDDEVTYPAIYGVLEKAHATNNLTDFGKALYEQS